MRLRDKSPFDLAVSHHERKFVRNHLPHAINCEQLTGISPVLLLAMSALDTDWGLLIRHNQCFAIRNPTWKDKYREVIEVTPIPSYRQKDVSKSTPFIDSGVIMFMNTRNGYYREYENRQESFLDQCRFLMDKHSRILKYNIHEIPRKYLWWYCPTHDFRRNLTVAMAKIQKIMMGLDPKGFHNYDIVSFEVTDKPPLTDD